MKNMAKLTVICLLATMLLAAAQPAAAGVSQTGTSEAKVVFAGGKLEFDGTKTQVSEINFGEREKPGRAHVYYANGGSEYGLSDATNAAVTVPGSGSAGVYISDKRAASAIVNWKLTATCTKFSDGASSEFGGTLQLVAGTKVADPTTNIAKLIVGDGVSPDIQIPLGETQEVRVLTGDNAGTPKLGKGQFGISWTGENIRLSVPAGEFSNVQVAVYEAKLTWTLESP